MALTKVGINTLKDTAKTVLSESFAEPSAISGSFLGQGAITSSAQIASDISGSLGANATLIRSLTAAGITGSFTALSASITTRIAAEEAEAEGTVVSSSAQIASDISGSLGSNATLIRSLTAVGVSGSFISVSSSLASRIAAEEAEAEGTVVSSSAQIATDISGSLGANASLIRSLTATAISGSVVAGVSGSVLSTGSFGLVHTAGRVSIATGSHEAKLNVYHDANNEWTALFTQDYVQGYGVKITGDMTGTDPLFKVMSENTATRFRVQGDGKVGIGTNSPDYSLDVAGDAGFNEYIYHNGDADTYIRFAPDLVNLVAGGFSAIKYEKSAGKIIINNTNENVDFHVMAEDNSELLATDAANNRVGINTATPSVALEVIGSISGSSTSTGSFGKLEVGGSSTLTGDLTVGGRLTAQEFHTEFVSSSIMFQSGSTKFGDSAADTHTFTGKMEISGSQAKVSASVGATGSFGHLFLAKGAHITDRLYFSDVGGEYISGDGTDLNLTSGADINIPSGIGLTFGNDGEIIEGNGTDLTIKGGDINITAETDVNIPSGVGVTFGNDGEKIEGNGTKLDIAAAEIDFSIEGSGDINIGADIGLTFGNDGEKIEGNGTRMSIASGTGMVLDCEGDIEINADGGDIDFKDDSAHLLKVSSTKVSGSAASTGSFGRIEGSVFSGSFIGKGTFNNIDDPTAMAIALG